ncbi:prepilin peptidase [Amycolatopsis palatopharyngis]|uniref:prepilin peptidase n=1 Tax=Amycolatopsis palatopharyngis TaxID=187982 RepID=UPI0013BE9E20|nr:prepilin peptidase [Amycolatopsis palatopharyngis]
MLFAALAAGFGHRWELVPYGVLAVVSVPLAITDIIEQRLSSALVLPLGITLLALFAVLAVAQADGASLLRAVLAMAALAGFHLVLALLLGGLGAGDVKLSAVLGIATGWTGWPAVIGMLLLAYVTASLTVLLDRLRHRANRLEAIPLGPYLIFSAFVTIVTLGA